MIAAKNSRIRPKPGVQAQPDGQDVDIPVDFEIPTGNRQLARTPVRPLHPDQDHLRADGVDPVELSTVAGSTDLASTPDASYFDIRQAPLQGFKKPRNSIPSGIDLKRTPQHDSSEIDDPEVSCSRRSTAWSLSLVEIQNQTKENEKPIENLIPTGSQLHRTPFVKNRESIGLSSNSHEEVTPPDQRRFPLLPGGFRVARERSQLSSGSACVGSLVPSVPSTPIPGHTGVSKPTGDQPAAVPISIDDIVVAAAAVRQEMATPEAKVITSVNVIPTGKQLARTPHVKGCASFGNLSLDTSREGDHSEASCSNGGLLLGSSECDEAVETSTSSGSKPQSSVQEEEVASPIPQDPSETLPSSRPGTSRTVAKSRSGGSRSTGKAEKAASALKQTPKQDGSVQSVPAPEKTTEVAAKAEGHPKKRFVLSKKDAALSEPTGSSEVASSVRGRSRRNVPENPTVDSDKVCVPPVASAKPARRSTRGAKSSSTAAASEGSSVPSSSAANNSMKSVAKEKRVLATRSGKGEMETIKEALDETVLDQVEPIVSFSRNLR